MTETYGSGAIHFNIMPVVQYRIDPLSLGNLLQMLIYRTCAKYKILIIIHSRWYMYIAILTVPSESDIQHWTVHNLLLSLEQLVRQPVKPKESITYLSM